MCTVLDSSFTSLRLRLPDNSLPRNHHCILAGDFVEIQLPVFEDLTPQARRIFCSTFVCRLGTVDGIDIVNVHVGVDIFLAEGIL